MLALLLTRAALAGTACEEGNIITLLDREGSFELTEKEYINNLDLCWEIRPTCGEGRQVSLTFPTVAIEEGYDFLIVRDFDNRLKEQVEQGATYGARSGFLVRFTTDATTTDSGFVGKWQCGGAGSEG